jgi:DUF309 family protein family protein
MACPYVVPFYSGANIFTALCIVLAVRNPRNRRAKPDPMADMFDGGIRLFNRRKFFEAHEALEAVWLKAEGDDKVLLHGLIQIAAAFHHFQRRNVPGFRSLLEKGSRKLERFGEERDGIDLGRLGEAIRRWGAYLGGDRRVHRDTPPPWPRIFKRVS